MATQTTPQTTNAATSVKDLIAEARTKIDNLPCAAMAQALEAPDVLLVDLREPAERAQNGTIPGALAAPRGMLEFYADPTMPYHKPEFQRSRRILLYCASGGRSALAGASLRRLGYDRVASLDGGFKAWQESGREVAPVQA
ncbi:MAG: rhodanese-like domain-containing protein [bacterium]